MASFAFSLVSRLRQNGRRAIGFLRDESDLKLDAVACFEQLEQKAAFTVRSRFDHWIDNGVT